MTSLFSMHTALLRLRCAVATANFESRARQLRRAIEEKFDPDQPRDDQGRWTDADTGHAGDIGDSADKEANVNDILAKAKRLAASRATMERCVDLCYRLLERFQPPGSDRNQWDFHKCLNACLGK